MYMLPPAPDPPEPLQLNWVPVSPSALTEPVMLRSCATEINIAPPPALPPRLPPALPPLPQVVGAKALPYSFKPQEVPPFWPQPACPPPPPALLETHGPESAGKPPPFALTDPAITVFAADIRNIEDAPPETRLPPAAIVSVPVTAIETRPVYVNVAVAATLIDEYITATFPGPSVHVCPAVRDSAPPTTSDEQSARRRAATGAAAERQGSSRPPPSTPAREASAARPINEKIHTHRKRAS
jgi:hypothetical protein